MVRGPQIETEDERAPHEHHEHLKKPDPREKAPPRAEKRSHGDVRGQHPIEGARLLFLQEAPRCPRHREEQEHDPDAGCVVGDDRRAVAFALFLSLHGTGGLHLDQTGETSPTITFCAVTFCALAVAGVS